MSQRTRTLKPSTRPCLGGHKFKTYDEYEAACENIRPWPGEDMLVGECRRCHSTLAWTIHPTRYPEENPMRERSERPLGRAARNPHPMRRVSLTPAELDWATWAVDPMQDYWEGLIADGEEETMPPLPSFEGNVLLMPAHDGVLADFLERIKDLAPDIIEEDFDNFPPWPKGGLNDRGKALLNDRGKAQMRAVKSLAKKLLISSTER
jgi:hypothetical protein